MNRHEIFGAALIFFFGAATAYLSTRMAIGDFRAPGSGMFPLCLGILLMLLSAIHLLKTSLRNRNGDEKKGANTDSGGGTPRATSRVILFMGAVVAATLLLDPLGYPLVSFLLLLALFRILGVKNWGLMFLVALVTACVSYFLFVHWLKIPLPKGWLGL